MMYSCESYAKDPNHEHDNSTEANDTFIMRNYAHPVE